MGFTDVVGNIFLLDKRLNRKVILRAVLLTAIIAVLKFLFDKESISKNFNISEFMLTIIAVSIVYIFVNYKLLWEFVHKYSSFNFEVVFRTFFEIIIAISILFVGERDIFSWVLAVFWLLSGYLRVLLQFTKAVFEADLHKYLKVLQIFAYIRAGYLAMVILFGSQIITLTPSAYIPYVLILFAICLLFMSNLNPYLIKHDDVKKAVLLLRKIKDNKRIKLSTLQKDSGFSQEYYNKIILRYVNYKLIKITGNHVELGDALNKIN